MKGDTRNSDYSSDYVRDFVQLAASQHLPVLSPAKIINYYNGLYRV